MRLRSPAFAAASLLLVSLLPVSLAMPLLAANAEMDHKTLHVAHGWAQASLGASPNSAAYVTIHNPTEVADKVVRVSCAGADRCAIHTHINEDGVMKMRKVETLSIKPGAHLEFAPGGYHIMLFDVTAPFVAGEETAITFTFEKAGAVTIAAKILTLREAADKARKMDHKKMNHDSQHKH